MLGPSERYYRKLGRRHKKLTDWARQMILQLRRWLPKRPLVLVGDNGYAVLDLLHFSQSLREPVTLIARLRLDAGLYDPAPPHPPGQTGRPRARAHASPPSSPGKDTWPQRNAGSNLWRVAQAGGSGMGPEDPRLELPAAGSRGGISPVR